MKRDDRIGGFIWLILGIGLCLGSVKLKIGGFHNPEPGFMPFLSGALLSIFGFVLLLSRGSQVSGTTRMIEEEKAFVTKASRRFFIPFITLLILLIYIALLEPLGFLLATLFFLFSLFKFVEPKKWFMPFILSLTSGILSYLVFSVWLRCQLPRGILGF